MPEERDSLTEKVIGAAIEVHRELGPGLLESIYQSCMELELSMQGIEFRRKVPVPVIYKGQRVQADLEIDLLIPNRLVIELKAVESILPVHKAQIITYLKLTKIRVGLLLNFNVPLLKDGIHRIVLG